MGLLTSQGHCTKDPLLEPLLPNQPFSKELSGILGICPEMKSKLPLPGCSVGRASMVGCGWSLLWLKVVTTILWVTERREKSWPLVYSNNSFFTLLQQNCYCLSVCLSAWLCVCLPGCLPVCLSLSVCLPGCLSVCLAVCLSACLVVCLSAWMSVCLYVCMHGWMHVSIYLSIHPSVYVCMYVCLCVCVYVCMDGCMDVWM